MKSSTAASFKTAPIVWPGLASGVLALATDGLYLYVMWRQGSERLQWGRAGFVALMIAALAVVVLIGSLRILPANLVASAGGLMVFGILGIFSIGFPLLVAAGLALWGAVRARRTESIPAILLRFLGWIVVFGIVALGGLAELIPGLASGRLNVP